MRGLLRLADVAAEIDILDTPAGRALAEVLPLEVSFQAGEEEIQFSLPLHPLPLDGAEAMRDPLVGELRYVPGSDLLVLSLGSASPAARPSSPDPPWLAGRIVGSPGRLREALHAATLRIEFRRQPTGAIAGGVERREGK